MSDYQAIRAVSETLKALIETAVANTPLAVTAHLETPKEMRLGTPKTGISLWLYRVTRNEHRLNQPAVRPQPNQLRRQPMPINLHYLVTPIMAQPADEQLLLGLLLQLFNDHPMVRGADLKDALAGGPEELRVTLETLSVEDLTRIWGALQEPYQTSLTYLVQVIEIESRLDPLAVAPIATSETSYYQILSSQ